MPDLILPYTKAMPAQIAVRCPGFVTMNNLGVVGPQGKYGIAIKRMAEPQDKGGNQCADRYELPDVVITDVVLIANETVVLSDGSKISVGRLLDAVNCFIDAHKGDGLSG